MTDTPTPAPAPMTAGKLKSLRETTQGNIRSRALRGLAPGSYATDIALLDHIDALTARVAELERDLATVMSDYSQIIAKQDDEIEAAEARAQAAEAQLKEVRKHSREAYDHLCSNAIESVRRSRAMELLRLVIALQTKDTTP